MTNPFEIVTYVLRECAKEFPHKVIEDGERHKVYQFKVNGYTADQHPTVTLQPDLATEDDAFVDVGLDRVHIHFDQRKKSQYQIACSSAQGFLKPLSMRCEQSDLRLDLSHLEFQNEPSERSITLRYRVSHQFGHDPMLTTDIPDTIGAPTVNRSYICGVVSDFLLGVPHRQEKSPFQGEYTAIGEGDEEIAVQVKTAEADGSFTIYIGLSRGMVSIEHDPLTILGNGFANPLTTRIRDACTSNGIEMALLQVGTWRAEAGQRVRGYGKPTVVTYRFDSLST